MSDTIKISVLVPIYNGGKYINDLLRTLQEQTYKNLEFIFVDDLSTDETVPVLEDAAKTDERIKLIRRETKGGFACKGVEYGFKFCTGDYFWFMSHDDFLDIDFFEKCAERALETQADVIVPNCILYYEGKDNKNTFDFPKNGDYTSEISNIEAFQQSLTWKIHGNTLRKIDLVKKIGVDAPYYNSDEVASRLSYLYARRIVFVNTNFYYRQDNPNAITKTLKWFMVDLLTTDILLFTKLEENLQDKTILENHLSRLNKAYFFWYRFYLKCKFNLIKTKIDKAKKRYMKTVLRANRKKLIFLNKKYSAKNKLRLIVI